MYQSEDAVTIQRRPYNITATQGRAEDVVTMHQLKQDDVIICQNTVVAVR